MNGYEWDFPNLQATGTVAEFSPVTCIVSAQPLLRDVERARIGSGALVEGLESNAAFYHELFHWVQFQSTTVGQFLLALRHSRDQLVFQLLLSDAGFRSDLLDARRIVPILQYEGSDKYLAKFDPSVSERLSHHRDIELVRRLFYMPESVGHTTYPVHAAFGRALRYVEWLEHNRRTTGEWAWPDVPSVNVIDEIDADIEVSTESILELSAVLMELAMHLTAGEIDQELLIYVVERIQTEIKAVRGSAIACVADDIITELFHAGEVGDATGLYHTAVRIACICDIALNPPLPPIAAIGEEVDWNELFPPARFIKLLKTATLSGFREEFDLSKETYVSMRDEMVRDAGLSYVGGGADVQPFPEVPDRRWHTRYHWRALRSSSERFFELRNDFPELLGLFGALFCGYRGESFTDAIQIRSEKWFLPPIFQSPEGIQSSGEDALGKLYVQSLAADYAMLDLVAGLPIPRLEKFPSTVRAELARMANEWIRERALM